MMAKALKAFARAKEGVAALEFALIAPLMIVVLFTSLELVNMLQSNQRVENTAISLADVISRDTSISNAEMTGIWSAVGSLMFPDNAAGMDLRITSIVFDDDGDASVVWSEVCGLTAAGACSGSSYSVLRRGAAVPASELPNVNPPGSSLIRVEVAFDFRPIVGFFSIGENGELGHDGGITTLRHTAFRRSRLVDPIPRV